jgi:hypothetical protein
MVIAGNRRRRGRSIFSSSARPAGSSQVPRERIPFRCARSESFAALLSSQGVESAYSSLPGYRFGSNCIGRAASKRLRPYPARRARALVSQRFNIWPSSPAAPGVAVPAFAISLVLAGALAESQSGSLYSRQRRASARLFRET